jgi:hypothetical protein
MTERFDVREVPEADEVDWRRRHIDSDQVGNQGSTWLTCPSKKQGLNDHNHHQLSALSITGCEKMHACLAKWA